MRSREGKREVAGVVRSAGALAFLSALGLASSALGQTRPPEVMRAESELVQRMDSAGVLRGKILLMPSVASEPKSKGRTPLSARVRGEVAEGVRVLLASDEGVALVGEGELAKALSDLTFKAENLSTPTRRSAVMRYLRADAICFVGGSSEPGRLRLRADLHPNDGSAGSAYEATAPKTSAVYPWLGEVPPGTLALSFPAGSQIALDGEVVEESGSGSLRLSLDAGEHQLRVHRAQYPAHARSFVVPSAGEVSLRVREKNNASAPVNSLVASALVPGLGIALYGRPKSTIPGTRTPEVVASTGALLFWAGAVMYAVDMTERDKFLTTKSSDRHKLIENVELAGAAVGYIINLVGAYSLGSEYAARNRELVSKAQDSPFRFVAPSAIALHHGAVAFGLRYRF